MEDSLAHLTQRQQNEVARLLAQIRAEYEALVLLIGQEEAGKLVISVWSKEEIALLLANSWSKEELDLLLPLEHS